MDIMSARVVLVDIGQEGSPVSEIVTRTWQEQAGGVPVQHQGVYSAFIPDTIANWSPHLDADTERAMADAAIALMRYQIGGSQAFAPEWIVNHAEGLASSTMEGVHSPLWRVAQAEALPDPASPTAEDDLQSAANVDITSAAVDMGLSGADLSVDDLCELNGTLMAVSAKAAQFGRLRKEQNWIGGMTPVRAVYVPPPPESVPWLMEDLVWFCNNSEMAPVFAAALAHWQFETVHPFADGNGRTGRALIHYVLARRGMVGKPTVPISAILVQDKARYISSLDTARHLGPPNSPERLDGIARWAKHFAESLVHACDYGERLKAATSAVRQSWSQALPNPTPAQMRLMEMLGSTPVINAKIAATGIGADEQTARRAIARLVEAGILEQRGDARRNRIFQAPAVLQCVDMAVSQVFETETAP
ncbi:MAG: Fic family protein [Acidimicrobiia bacterium]|nr:Fic family protein [Acidimicrobiia bacterium]